MIKKTYIPGKPRNPKLGTPTGTSGVGKTEFNQVAGSSHEHYNKGVLDQITEAMLVAALRDLITSTDTESELTDENILSSLRVLSEISKANADLLEEIKAKFLSKIEPDTAQKLIKFVEGVEVGAFTTGALGSGAAIKMLDGTSFAEVDNLTVRQKATFRELIIESLKHIGGQLVLTPARMKCIRVVDGGSFYKCYFDTGDGEVSNEFVAGDLARCQVFTGSGTKFYWRLVTLVGDDWINLSKTNAAVGSDAPEAGDDIAQLGNATDTTRQNAQILSTVGVDAPSWKQYKGINSFSLEGKDTTVFSGIGNRISGETVFTSGGANLEDHLDGVAQDILDALQAAQDADDKAQQAIEDAEADVATLNEEIGRLQDQIDGKVSNWYYAYSPTLSNYPASDWTTNEIKDSHIGDTFTNTEPAPAENAGKSWRFVKNGSTYSWTVISDSDALKALQEASKAQATADGKSTTYLFQPTKYKLGDMWVLNDDHTINGTQYKQGDLLTATQDSETFNEAHWLKRVRYTDDTAIDNLEIGGRNLFTNTAEDVIVVGDGSSNQITSNSIRTIGLVENGFKIGDKLTVSFKWAVDAPEDATISGEFYIRNVFPAYSLVPTMTNISRENMSGYITRTITLTETSIALDTFQPRLVSIPTNVKLIFKDIKLEKGNKATDWTPAPEDVEASIETAKADAESAAQAYADTKSEAERVLAEAYADDIVTAEEQARIDDVNDKLAIAKEHADAQDALLKIQQEAYADDKISSAEQAAIQAARDYADLKKTEAEAYADGIVSDEEARAIADALDKYNASKAHAEQLVKDIEIGGRNLFKPFNDGYAINNQYRQLRVEGGIVYWKQLTTATHGQPLTIHNYDTYRRDYTFSYKTNAPVNLIRTSLYQGAHLNPQSTIEDKGDYRYVILKFTAELTSNSINWYGTDPAEPIEEFAFWDFMFERGNTATDWTPAPEDVESSIETAKTEAENAAKEYALQKAEAERVLAEAYADGIVSDEEQARIDDVNDKLAIAKEYADSAAEAERVIAEAYADGEISKAEQAAIDVAIAYADVKKTEAEAYADDIVSDEEERAIADAQAKYEAAKAHAETLVDNLEIGGRNLFTNTAEDVIVVGDGSSNQITSNSIRTIGLVENGFKIGDKLTVSFKWAVDAPEDATISGEFYIRNVFPAYSLVPTMTNISRENMSGYITRTITLTETSIALDTFQPRLVSIPTNVKLIFKDIKLEKGNKATDWTPAPEDVEASIETAKADAESAAQAYADTKSEAERVLAEAYADDIVTAEEQARIDDVNDKLAIAKEHADAQDALLKIQQEAYADDKISSAEQAAIQAARDYADLKKTEAEAYADGIVSDEEARAIADALDKYNASKAHAEQLVKDIEIGGRNLFKPFNDGYAINNQYRQLRVEGGIVYWKQLTTATHGQPLTIHNYDTYRRDYTFSYKTNAPVNLIRTSLYQGAHLNPQSTIEDKGDYRYVILKFTAELTSNSINWYGTDPAEPIEEFAFWDFMFERGNTATDWTPAPEDTERELLESQGYMKARYIRDYLNGSSVDARNYWVQIKALNKAGTNIALNKTVTSNIDTVNLARITNGDMDVENFARTLGGNQYVQIDLGQVYYDIDNINVYHYWADSRTFYGTKTQISEDGVTWKTIFDSAVSGTYKETAGGKVHTTKLTDLVENAQARIDAEKTRINDILSDNVADPSEKQYLSNLWQEIYAEYPRIWAQANDYSVSSVIKTTYEQKYTALKNILDPILANLTINSTVSGSSIRTAFSQYYDARTALQNAITNKANQNAVDALAKANTAAAITDKFSGFNGGLATAVIMEMREPSTTARGDATAGISGIQGAAKDEPAFWAGGTYDQAIGGTAKAIIRHDGSGQLAGGNIEWDDAGNVELSGKIASGESISTIGDKIKLNADGSGHLANGNIEWNAAGGVEMTGIEAIDALFTGSVKTPFKPISFHNPNQTYGTNLYLDNNNDLTTIELPTLTSANGMAIRIVNNRSSSKTIRTPLGAPVPIYNNNHASDSNRHDMPAYSYCELIAFGDSASLRGWVVTTQVGL